MINQAPTLEVNHPETILVSSSFVFVLSLQRSKTQGQSHGTALSLRSGENATSNWNKQDFSAEYWK